jgi:rfaE bifunctional protein nucleotidyltransferase chain/domain
MSRAIFLDRDGTLNDDLGYTYKVESFELLEGVIGGLRRLGDFKLFIITNQSGIGRGYYSEEDMHKYNNRMLEEFRKHGIEIERIYFCPHHPDEPCDCRKPNPKSMLEAKKEFGLDLEKSFVIGDHASDVTLAKNSGCKSVYLLTGHGVKHLEEARIAGPDYVAANFRQAADYILSDALKKIVNRNELTELVDEVRKDGKSIVTINGTFDILHKGHEKILSEAKKQGEVLIVGVNSDNSVKKNKGPTRPVNNEINRVKMLANFSFVDYVTIFDEETPIELLKIIKPDVHVNGSEYGKKCIEASIVEENGGRIHVVKLVEGYSTTNSIKHKK